MTEHELAKQREYRLRTGNSVTRRYEKTKHGKLMRTYRNMLSRVKGIQWRKEHLYGGKEVLPKDEFYAWALANKSFHILYEAWEQSGFDRKLAPSVDRIDSQKGYTLDNMRWITHSENSRQGAVSRWGKRHVL